MVERKGGIAGFVNVFFLVWFIGGEEMAKSSDKPKGGKVSLYPLTSEQAISGMFKIAPADVKRIVGSKPAKKGKAKGKGGDNRD